jgi:hypothetical protein
MNVNLRAVAAETLSISSAAATSVPVAATFSWPNS